MIILAAIVLVVLGLMVLKCDVLMSDGSVYRPVLESSIILASALSLIVLC